MTPWRKPRRPNAAALQSTVTETQFSLLQLQTLTSQEPSPSLGVETKTPPHQPKGDASALLALPVADGNPRHVDLSSLIGHYIALLRTINI